MATLILYIYLEVKKNDDRSAVLRVYKIAGVLCDANERIKVDL